MIALLLLAQTTFYVDDANGDDVNNPGTVTDPWATLQRAADAVGPGDTVIVRAGSYEGMQLETSGTANARITFSAEAGAVVDADNPTTPDGINLEGASYVTVEGFEVTGVTRAGIRAVLCSDVIIRNNVLDQNGRWGVLTGFCDDVSIEGNQASRSGIEHGIYVSNSGDRPVIRNNRIFSNNANGIHMNGDISLGGDGVISDALVEGNIIWDNGQAGGSGINCDGVQNSVFQNNVIYDTHASGVSFYQIDGGEPAMNNLLVNNTIIVAADGRWALNIQDASTGNRAFNNILVNLHNTRGSIDISADSLTGFTSDANMFIDRFTVDGGNNITLADWRTQTGQDANSIAIAQGDITTDGALFVAPSNTDYHLAPGSDAIDNGRAQDAPPADLEGVARPQGAGVDIGAYESCPAAGCMGGAVDAGAVDAGGTMDAQVGDDAATNEDAMMMIDTDAGIEFDAAIAKDAEVDGGGQNRTPDAAGGVDGGIIDDADEGCGCTASRTGSHSALALLVLLFAPIFAPRRRLR
jgi:parallel beta-helix repeat protein